MGLRLLFSRPLTEFPDLGHAPQIQTPDAFHAVLHDWLTVSPTANIDVPKP